MDTENRKPRKKKRVRINKKKAARALVLLLILIAVLAFGIRSAVKAVGKLLDEKRQSQISDEPANYEPPEIKTLAEEFIDAASVKAIGDDIVSKYSVLINAKTKEIVAEKNSRDRIYPASMTKVLALLTAAENCESWEGTMNMERDVEEYCFVNKCSVVGYERGELIKIDELPYGTILSSGADATISMAVHTAGSHEAFADLMNKKAESLGIGASSHFQNSVGIFADDHYTTVKDMAVIMYAAMGNAFCRKVLTTQSFETDPTENHPKGQVLLNLFLSRISTKDSGSLTVIGAKTGYVGEAGFCAVSYAEDEDGTPYICVTADSSGVWQTVIDHANIYKHYVKQEPAAAGQ